MRRPALLGLVLSLLGVWSTACSEEVLIGMDRLDGGIATGATAGTGGTGTGGTGTGGTGTGGTEMAGAGGVLALGGAASGSSGATSASAGAGGCQVARCGSTVFACGDCDDNDGDSLVDANDPECLGPCDDTEDSLMLGIPGNNPGSCRADCAFDRGAGRNDGCLYTHECDVLAVEPDYPPTGRSKCAYDEGATIPGSSVTCAESRATQPAECLEGCLPLAPNGCDCFGCCELPGRSGQFVWVGAEVGGCTLATLDDETLCPRCTPVRSCFNECGECEYCAGGVVPAGSCGGVASPCDFGRPSCGEGAVCALGNYCITGCCVPEPH